MQLTDGAGIVPDPAALFALLFACGGAAGLVPSSWLAFPFRSLLPTFPLFFFFPPKNNPSITGLVFSALGPGSAGNAKGGRIPKAGIITRGCCSLFGIVDFIKLGTGALQSLWIREGASFPLPAWIQLPGGWGNARERHNSQQREWERGSGGGNVAPPSPSRPPGHTFWLLWCRERFSIRKILPGAGEAGNSFVSCPNLLNNFPFL